MKVIYNLFKPKIYRFKKTRNVDKLIKALWYNYDPNIRIEAANAIADIAIDDYKKKINNLKTIDIILIDEYNITMLINNLIDNEIDLQVKKSFVNMLGKLCSVDSRYYNKYLLSVMDLIIKKDLPKDIVLQLLYCININDYKKYLTKIFIYNIISDRQIADNLGIIIEYYNEADIKDKALNIYNEYIELCINYIDSKNIFSGLNYSFSNNIWDELKIIAKHIYPYSITQLKGADDNVTIEKYICILGHLGIKDALTHIYDYIKNSNDHVRACVAECYGELADDESELKVLIKMTKDESAFVSSKACSALEKVRARIFVRKDRVIWYGTSFNEFFTINSFNELLNELPGVTTDKQQRCKNMKNTLISEDHIIDIVKRSLFDGEYQAKYKKGLRECSVLRLQGRDIGYEFQIEYLYRGTTVVTPYYLYRNFLTNDYLFCEGVIQ
jgi:hypothetical protein